MVAKLWRSEAGLYETLELFHLALIPELLQEVSGVRKSADMGDVLVTVRGRGDQNVLGHHDHPALLPVPSMRQTVISIATLQQAWTCRHARSGNRQDQAVDCAAGAAGDPGRAAARRKYRF